MLHPHVVGNARIGDAPIHQILLKVRIGLILADRQVIHEVGYCRYAILPKGIVEHVDHRLIEVGDRIAKLVIRRSVAVYVARVGIELRLRDGAITIRIHVGLVITA